MGRAPFGKAGAARLLRMRGKRRCALGLRAAVSKCPAVAGGRASLPAGEGGRERGPPPGEAASTGGCGGEPVAG